MLLPDEDDHHDRRESTWRRDCENDGTWMAGPFQTNDQAWRWYDRHFSAGAFDAEHRNAVRTKINEDGALW